VERSDGSQGVQRRAHRRLASPGLRAVTPAAQTAMVRINFSGVERRKIRPGSRRGQAGAQGCSQCGRGAVTPPPGPCFFLLPHQPGQPWGRAAMPEHRPAPSPCVTEASGCCQLCPAHPSPRPPREGFGLEEDLTPPHHPARVPVALVTVAIVSPE